MTLPTPETVIVLVDAEPLETVKPSVPVVAVTMPFGLNCKVVEGLRLIPPPVVHGIAAPTLVKLPAHAGGVPEIAWLCTWYVVEPAVKAIVYEQPVMMA